MSSTCCQIFIWSVQEDSVCASSWCHDRHTQGLSSSSFKFFIAWDTAHWVLRSSCFQWPPVIDRHRNEILITYNDDDNVSITLHHKVKNLHTVNWAGTNTQWCNLLVPWAIQYYVVQQQPNNYSIVCLSAYRIAGKFGKDLNLTFGGLHE